MWPAPAKVTHQYDLAPRGRWGRARRSPVAGAGPAAAASAEAEEDTAELLRQFIDEACA